MNQMLKLAPDSHFTSRTNFSLWKVHSAGRFNNKETAAASRTVGQFGCFLMSAY